MVNARCNFCENTYRRNPGVGYYKVTAALKTSLGLKEGADLNTICGEHFSETDIAESGRLKPVARPVFFPRQLKVSHDHTYHSSNNIEEDIEGTFFLSFQLHISMN